jgi:hypothetical protein
MDTFNLMCSSVHSQIICLAWIIGRIIMKKLIISGIRTCNRKDAVFAEINKFVAEIGAVDEIVAGGSTGVDMIAKMYAETKNLKYKEFVPNWQDDLNSAGMVRDTRMAEYGTHLLVLSNGVSKESKNLIEEAKRNNLVIKTVGVFVGVPESEMALPVGTPAF